MKSFFNSVEAKSITLRKVRRTARSRKGNQRESRGTDLTLLLSFPRREISEQNLNTWQESSIDRKRSKGSFLSFLFLFIANFFKLHSSNNAC